MSKIKIKNFGPIRSGFEENDGFIDIKKVTVFIGNQGAGKSSVAKLISTMTWLEKALRRGELTENEVTKYNRLVNNYCAYQGVKSYFMADTEIEFHGNAFAFYYSEGKLRIDSLDEKYALPKIMYIPAERNFVSVVNNPDKLKGLPRPLLTFLTEYEKAQESIKDSLLLPINNVAFEYDKLNKIANIRGEGYKIRLSEASSGFQSAVPLFLVSEFLAKSIGKDSDASKTDLSAEEERRIRSEIRKIFENPKLTDEFKRAAMEEIASRYLNACFINIVEEPEQNLYPKSQRDILNKLLEFANFTEDNKLILTTHSPYIISYLTLAIKAHEILQKIEESGNKDVLKNELEQVVPLASCLAANQVLIYELDVNGGIKKLNTYGGIPSDENYLNQLLADTNVSFDKLLEIEEQCQ